MRPVKRYKFGLWFCSLNSSRREGAIQVLLKSIGIQHSKATMFGLSHHAAQFDPYCSRLHWKFIGRIFILLIYLFNEQKYVSWRWVRSCRQDRLMIPRVSWTYLHRGHGMHPLSSTPGVQNSTKQRTLKSLSQNWWMTKNVHSDALSMQWTMNTRSREFRKTWETVRAIGMASASQTFCSAQWCSFVFSTDTRL